MAKTYSNYPQAARKAARRALKHKERNGSSCGTAVGWTRANTIASGTGMTLSTVKRTFSFLSRAAVYNQGKFTDEKGKDICGSIMYAAWGGSSMRSWCSGVIKKAERQAANEIESRNITPAVKKGLQKKVEDHNEKDPKHRATYSMLAACFRRGIGAYKTNPGSVRPNVKSPEQWAYARCNSLLYCLRNEKFRSGKHDQDLLPSSHPLSTKRSVTVTEEQRHVMAVQETDESIYITLQKAPGFGGVQQDPLSNPQSPSSGGGDSEGGGFTPAPSRPQSPEPISQDPGGKKAMPDEEEQREPNMSEIERRHVDVTENTEVRLADEGRTVEGYAAVFGQPTMIGAVEEVVSHGAFDDRLHDDVVALFNHDQNMPLARSYQGQGTLELKVDEHGLFYSFKLGNQSYAKDLAESIKRGDVRGSSFGFVVREDDYEKKADGSYRRTIKRVARIADISPVVSPAYPQTSVKMRDMIAALEAEKEIEQTPENETPPTLAPKRKQAEALLSIHHHNSPKK